MSVKFKIESGAQLLARLTKKPSIENFYPHLFQSGPISGDIIEICSNTYTSHLLTDIICKALIYNKVNEVPADLLIFETDGNMDYAELKNVLKRKLLTMSSHNIRLDSAELNKEVHKMLARLHILNIYDTTQFITTIYNLENTLVEHPRISMIIFNTLTAFYWSEQGFKITKMDLYTKNLINTIQNVTKEHKIICMYTLPEYFCANKMSETINTELNYQIQLLENNKGDYQVNIKTANTKQTKFYRVIDNDIKWMI